jgi:hypothetical protein
MLSFFTLAFCFSSVQALSCTLQTQNVLGNIRSCQVSYDPSSGFHRECTANTTTLGLAPTDVGTFFSVAEGEDKWRVVIGPPGRSNWVPPSTPCPIQVMMAQDGAGGITRGNTFANVTVTNTTSPPQAAICSRAFGCCAGKLASGLFQCETSNQTLQAFQLPSSCPGIGTLTTPMEFFNFVKVPAVASPDDPNQFGAAWSISESLTTIGETISVSCT